MSDLDTTTELDRRHRELLFSLRLPDAVIGPDAPPFVRNLDLAFARQLFGGDQPWGQEDVFDERERFLNDVLCASADGRRLHLASEVAMLSRVKETGKDVLHDGPFGMREFVAPVVMRGHVVHILRSGKFRNTPFPPDELKDLSFLSGVPMRKLEEAVKVIPVFDDARRDQMLGFIRKWRDASARALAEHERVTDLADQHVKTERIQALGSMAEGMAHHVNGILSSILAYSAATQDRTGIADDVVQILRRIGEEAQRGRRFTEEILAMSTAEAETTQVCSVHDRIRNTLQLLQQQMGTKIKLETVLTATNDRVMAQPRVLQQILFNVITNALDHMPTGGLLTIATKDVKDERASDAPSYLRLEVTDSSGNMPGRRSTRGTAGRSTAGGLAGENLGPKLTSVLGMVGRLEGTVTVASDPGMVTTVEVTIPSCTGEIRSTPDVVWSSRRRLAPSSIWVADDDQMVREMCRRVLAEEGHTVVELESGEEVRAKCIDQGQKPDLLIYDFSMPDFDGLEMTSHLREEGVRAPVLLISGLKPDQPDISRTLKLRKTFFLQKPFSFRDMTDMVTVALGETLIEE